MTDVAQAGQGRLQVVESTWHGSVCYDADSHVSRYKLFSVNRNQREANGELGRRRQVETFLTVPLKKTGFKWL